MKKLQEETLLRIAKYYSLGMEKEDIASKLEISTKEVERSINILASNYSFTYLDADKNRTLVKLGLN